MHRSEAKPLPADATSANQGTTHRTAAYYAAFVALGLAGASLGPTLPALAANVRTPLSGVSLLFTASSLGYLIGSYQGGRAYDRLPGHPVMVGMLLLLALTLALVPVLPSLWLLIMVRLALGIAQGTLDVGGNTLLMWTHGHRVGPFMNGMHFFWGLGACLSPVIIARVVAESGGIRWAYWILALLMLPAALWLLHLPSPASPAATEDRLAGRADGLLIGLIAAFLFLYVGAEVGFGDWIYTYAVRLGVNDSVTAAYLTSAFWGSLTVGRLLAIPIAARLSPSTILLGDLAGCLAGVGLILLCPGSAVATWAGTLLAGLAMASIFPITISLAERHMAITGHITGLFGMGASAGGMVVPWLIGQFFESVGPSITMVFIGADLAVAIGIYVLLTARARYVFTNSTGTTCQPVR